MKRIITALITAVLAVTLTGCYPDGQKSSGEAAYSASGGQSFDTSSLEFEHFVFSAELPTEKPDKLPAYKLDLGFKDPEGFMENAKEVFAAGREYTLRYEDKDNGFYTYEFDELSDMVFDIHYGIFGYVSPYENVHGQRYCASAINTQAYFPSFFPEFRGEMNGFSRAEAARKAREYLAKLDIDADSFAEPEIYFFPVEDMNNYYLVTYPDVTEGIFAEGDECYCLMYKSKINDTDILINTDNCPEIEIILNSNEILSISGSFLFHESEPLEEVEIKLDAYTVASKVSEYYSKQLLKTDAVITDCQLLYAVNNYDSKKRETIVKPYWILKGYRKNENNGVDWRVILYIDPETGAVMNEV